MDYREEIAELARERADEALRQREMGRNLTGERPDSEQRREMIRERLFHAYFYSLAMSVTEGERLEKEKQR